MSKESYTVNDLVHNLSFRRMIEGKASVEEENKWNCWIEANEEHRETARQAAAQISGFEFKSPEHPDIKKEWDELYRTTIGEKRLEAKGSVGKDTLLVWAYRVAAILILGAFVGWGVYGYLQNEQLSTQVNKIVETHTITTGPNEKIKISFVNGSTVVLNSNSMLAYTTGGAQAQTVNIELEGEAYFNAKGGHKSPQPIFVIHTPEGVIRDIGTQFLVSARDGRARVVLQEGKVKINMEGKTGSNRTITIYKDEMIVFNKEEVLKKETVNPTFYTSWATGFVRFDQTSIQEVADFVEYRFDVNVEIVDPKVANIKLDGSIYFKTFQDLVFAIAEVADIKAYQSTDKKTIYLESKI